MRIVTNNAPRPVLYGYELSEREAQEFDYISPEDLESHAFFRYRGRVYDLSEFMRIDRTVAPHPQLEGWEKWDGYASDSALSGLLVRYVEDGERVTVGTFYSYS